MFRGQRAPRSSRTIAEDKNDKSKFGDPIVQQEPTAGYKDAAASLPDKVRYPTSGPAKKKP